MTRANPRRQLWMWRVSAVAVLTVCAGVGWSASVAQGPAANIAEDPIQVELSDLEVVNRSPAIVLDVDAGHLDIEPAPGQVRRVSVLVYLEPVRDGDRATADANRAAVRNFAAVNEGVVRYEYKLLPDVLNLRDIPVSELDNLAEMPGVARVEEDTYDIRINLHDSTSLVNGLQSQLGAAGLSADGAGVRVCVADTGIDSDHVMYADRIDASAGYDFYNNDSNPEDDMGHGSHVAGIALGGTGLTVDFGCVGSEPFQGVAPEATLIGVKVLNQFGGGFDSDIIAGIDHCADQSPSGGRADVINLSIGTGQYGGPCSHSWAVAANNAVANGVVVVAASGNENYTNALSSPACGANVIAVGATYDENFPNCEDSTSTFNWGNCVDVTPSVDDVVCFSNESDYLDVAAPGSVIYSASTAAGGGSITGQSGTSMASPHVAGLAALILGVDPALTPAEVRQIIRDGAIDMGAAGFDRGYGYGRIDVVNTLQLVGGGCTVDGDCDDGQYCNGAETCVGGACQAGSSVNCNDGVACTGDSCNEATDSCDNLPSDAFCDNGQYCDGTETCDALSGCQAGTAVDCDDAEACTIDSCNEGTDSCDNLPDDGYCDDGVFCNGAETCSPSFGCQAGGDPCPGEECDEVNDVCIECSVDGDCDDGLFCNGTESCAGGVCQAGSDPCDPGQICNETTDTCDDVDCLVDGDCDDGNACTLDTCDAGICLNECPGAVSAYPYAEGFETGLGDWVNDSGDDINWSRRSGSTPSSGTGPSGAHGGSYYVYIEASSPNYPGRTAILEGPCFDLADTSAAELSFWYHMYGGGMGSLNVQASTDCESWASVWSRSGDQGNNWYQATVDLSSYAGQTVVLRFFGTTGSSWQSDIAIDDVSVAVTPAISCVDDLECDDGEFCNGAEVCAGGFCGPGSDPCPGQSCDEVSDLCVAGPAFEDDFESGNTQGWSLYAAGSTASTGNWTIGDPNGTSTGGSQAQPEDAFEGGGCIFTAQNTSLGSDDVDGGVVYLVSPAIDLSGAGSAELRFVRWFFNRDTGEDAGDFYVADVSDNDGGSWVNLETLGSSQSANNWTERVFALESYISLTSTVRLRFGASDGPSAGNIIEAALDNVLVTAGGGCTGDGDCDDGLFCNGAESCVDGSCQPGAAVDCDDGVSCTDDSCNEGTDACDNLANDANCDNGQYCDGVETCDPSFDCQAGTAVDCDDGQFCNGAESCVGGACQAGGDPCPGQSCDEGTDQCLSGSAARLEAGALAVGGGYTTVNLANTYANPVVVCTVQYDSSTTPVVTRISNVTADSFDVRLQNPSGGAVATENVSYLVVEEGAWTVDGVNIEAQSYLSTVTAENNSWVTEAQDYLQSYTSPVVIGQVMSENDADWSVFWCQGVTRQTPPSSGLISTGKTVCEDPDTVRADETVGFVVFESGHGTIGGVAFEAQLGADSVRGVTNNPPYTYSFAAPFATAPQIGLAAQAGMDGGNGGWAQIHGPTLATTTTLYLSIDEDQVNDPERNHTTEQVGYIVFEEAVVYP